MKEEIYKTVYDLEEHRAKLSFSRLSEATRDQVKKRLKNILKPETLDKFFSSEPEVEDVPPDGVLARIRSIYVVSDKGDTVTLLALWHFKYDEISDPEGRFRPNIEWPWDNGSLEVTVGVRRLSLKPEMRGRTGVKKEK